jgi:hypothetical protein
VNTGERKVPPDIVVTADATTHTSAICFLKYGRRAGFVIDQRASCIQRTVECARQFEVPRPPQLRHGEHSATEP